MKNKRDYSLSNFLVFNEEKKWLFNTARSTYIIVDNYDELNYILNVTNWDTHIGVTDERVQQMIDNEILISSERNEVAEVNYIIEERDSSILTIMMIVTRACNFSCSYCFEENDNVYMQEDVYSGAISFIKRKIYNGNYKVLNISFFGGEPSLCSQEIVKFMNNLRNDLGDKIKINGSITSNGYLLSEAMFKEFISCGITHYQITVDGLKETHDSSRKLLDGGATWDKIIFNLKSFNRIEASYEVVVRFNYSKTSIGIMDAFFDFFRTTFSDNNRISLYFEAVKDLGGQKVNKIKLVESESALTSKLLKSVSKTDINLKTFENVIGICSLKCYASDKNFFAIDVDGTLRKCTVHFNHPYNDVGTVYLDSWEKNSCWTSFALPDKCYSCSIYPVCCGKKCPILAVTGSFCKNLRCYHKSCVDIYIERRENESK